MNTTPDHITDSIERAKLRMAAAVGVLVVASGFGLGVVIHTTTPPSDPPPVVEPAEDGLVPPAVQG